MSDAITRKETLLKSIANGTSSALKPITREEQYLAYIAGESKSFPTTPITREEAFLDKIAKRGAGGGGSSINVQPLTVTENGTYDAPEGQAYDPVTVDVKPITEPITITENGVYPVPKGGSGGIVEYGKEYQFKDAEAMRATEEEMAEKIPISSLTDLGWAYQIFRNKSANIYFILNKSEVASGALYHLLASEDIIEGDRMPIATYRYQEFSSPAPGGVTATMPIGWYAGDGMMNPAPEYDVDGNTYTAKTIEPPTHLFPSSADQLETTLTMEQISLFFEVAGKSLDGWGDITVNVAGGSSGGGGDDVVNALIDRSISGNFRSNCESVGMYAFYKCQNLENITIPNATHIHDYAFSQSGIKSVNAPNITGCGSYAFQNCSSLASADFPMVTSIATSAFNGCKNLTNINLPRVTSLGESTFRDCKALTSADFPLLTSASSSGSIFYGCSKLTSVNLPKLTSAPYQCFFGCSALTSISLPAATSCSSYTFQNCTHMESADFPKFTSTGPSSFSACYALKSINLPVATSIGNGSFSSCTSLTDVNIPIATALNQNAFMSCSALSRLDCPKVTQISIQVFQGCHSLRTLILRSNTMCTLSNTSAFQNCYHYHGTVNATYNPEGLKDGYIYVPRDLIDDYKVATNWSTFADQFRAIEDYPEITGG